LFGAWQGGLKTRAYDVDSAATAGFPVNGRGTVPMNRDAPTFYQRDHHETNGLSQPLSTITEPAIRNGQPTLDRRPVSKYEPF